MSEASAAIKKVKASGDDYYRILGVDRDADEDTLKKAYRKLALRLHPDKCKEDGAEEAFKRVGEAFSTLSDARKRQTYDQFGADGVRERGAGGGGGHPSPEDIFQAFFGGGGMPGGVQFAQGGGMPGGFQTFHFSSGNGGANVFRFAGGPGGFGQQSSSAKPQQREAKEEAAVLPAWVSSLTTAASAFGPLLPLVVTAMFALGLMLMGTIMQFVMSRAMFFIPIVYLTEGRTKWTLLAAVCGGGMLGIL